MGGLIGGYVDGLGGEQRTHIVTGRLIVKPGGERGDVENGVQAFVTAHGSITFFD